jgi:hypothetical protein
VLQPRAKFRSGIRHLPSRDEVITNEHINTLRNELGV